MKLLFLSVLLITALPLHGSTIWLGGAIDPWAWRPWKAAGAMDLNKAGFLHFDASENQTESEIVAIWDIPDVRAEKLRLRFRVPNAGKAPVAVVCEFKLVAGMSIKATALRVTEKNGWVTCEAAVPLVKNEHPLINTVFIHFQASAQEQNAAFVEWVDLAYAELVGD
jgi:hypothetical protein